MARRTPTSRRPWAIVKCMSPNCGWLGPPADLPKHQEEAHAGLFEPAILQLYRDDQQIDAEVCANPNCEKTIAKGQTPYTNLGKDFCSRECADTAKTS
jgi:hypothetical protein